MKVKKPRIILWDLETIPDRKEVLKSYVGLSNWHGLTMRASLNSILCFGWKVLDEKKTHCDSVWEFSSDLNDDRALCEHIYKILSKADAIVTQNGKKFDLPFLQTRLMKHGLPPLPPSLKHIDTKTLMKRNLFLFSNSLDYASRFFTGDRKVDHEGWELWCRVYEGDKKAKKKMVEYCAHDVRLLEKLFKKLRCFAKDIPNHNILNTSATVCPSCGSHNLVKWGFHYGSTTKQQRYRCVDCQSSARGVKSIRVA